MITDPELADLVRIIRRAPLHNMDEAETVARLMQKLIEHLRPPKREPTNELGIPLRVVE